MGEGRNKAAPKIEALNRRTESNHFVNRGVYSSVMFELICSA
jgi:hypothetical protein